jgi:glycerol-3-phosphate dehydrogenase (NAD(P)+)
VVQRARQVGVEMPIAEGVLDLLDGKMRPDQAVAMLMEREPAADGI